MIVETLIGALVPVAAESIKQLIVRWTGGARPASVDETIRLMKAESDRLTALAALDQPGGTPSQWVIDLRASARIYWRFERDRGRHWFALCCRAAGACAHHRA